MRTAKNFISPREKFDEEFEEVFGIPDLKIDSPG